MSEKTTAEKSTAEKPAGPTGKATLQFEGKSYDFPVVAGTEGERAVDISKLRTASGLITLDNGYGNTGACQSSITSWFAPPCSEPQRAEMPAEMLA